MAVAGSARHVDDDDGVGGGGGGGCRSDRRQAIGSSQW